MSTDSDEKAEGPAGTESGSPPRLLTVVAAGIAVLLAVTIAIMGLMTGSTDNDTTDPLTLPAVPAPEADSPQCARLLEALPEKLESGSILLPRREPAEPAPPGTVAWGGAGTRKPVVLRCGVRRPAELSKTSRLQVVNGVRWLPVDARSTTTYYVVDRAVYLALTVPARVGTGAIQAVSDAVAATLEPQPPEF